MAVSVILVFFLLLIAGMFITGGITASITTFTTLAVLMVIAVMSLWQMTRLLQRDE